MSVDATKVLDFLKSPLRLLAGLWVAALILAFLPADVLARLRLTELMRLYGSYISLVLIGLTGILLAAAIASAWRQFSAWLGAHRRKKAVVARFLEADDAEKAVIREFVVRKCQTLSLPIQHQTVAGLINKSILLRAGAIGDGTVVGMAFPLCISPLLKALVTAEFVGFTEGMSSEQQAAFYGDNRPEFMAELDRSQRLRFGDWNDIMR